MSPEESSVRSEELLLLSKASETSSSSLDSRSSSATAFFSDTDSIGDAEEADIHTNKSNGSATVLSAPPTPPIFNLKEEVRSCVGKEQEDISVNASDSRTERDPDKFPFKLSVVSSNGVTCGLCNSLNCVGCVIPCSEQLISLHPSGCTIAVDWDPNLLKNNFDFEISETISIHRSVEELSLPKNRTISLMDCLNMFTTNEKLGANDPWYCPKCKAFQQAMKKFDLWKLPEILVVHLKRFQYSRWSRDKLNTMVEFPLEGLDLSAYVQGKQDATSVYDLFAVSNHMGGLGGGHYTAFAKNKYKDQWYFFNDSSVGKASVSSIQTSAAYVLFYRRRSPAQQRYFSGGDTKESQDLS